MLENRNNFIFFLEPSLKHIPLAKGKKIQVKTHHNKHAEQGNNPEQSKPKQQTDTRFDTEKGVRPVMQKISEAARKTSPSGKSRNINNIHHAKRAVSKQNYH